MIMITQIYTARAKGSRHHVTSWQGSLTRGLVLAILSPQSPLFYAIN